MDSFQLRYALNELIKDIPVYVCASDQLQLVNTKQFAIIVNTEPSSNSGSHWVCFYKPNDSSTIEFFDSYGVKVKYYGKYFLQFISKFHKIEQCLSQIQSYNSNVCGMYCLYFLYMRQQLTYNDVLKAFNLLRRHANDLVVRNFVASIKFPVFSSCGEVCSNQCKLKSDALSSVCYQVSKHCFKYSTEKQSQCPRIYKSSE